MRYLVAFVVILATLGLSANGKQAIPLDKLLARNVAVETGEGHGTGVIVSSGFVLTNFHVLHAGSEVKINGKLARVVKVDPKNDLALLATDTPPLSALQVAQSITLDQEIVCTGNPLEHKGMVSRGRIVAIENNSAYTDAHLFFGNSGGGAYNTSGELVGIVRGIEGKSGDGFPYGIIIPANVVRTFLELRRPKDISTKVSRPDSLK